MASVQFPLLSSFLHKGSTWRTLIQSIQVGREEDEKRIGPYDSFQEARIQI